MCTCYNRINALKGTCRQYIFLFYSEEGGVESEKAEDPKGAHPDMGISSSDSLGMR